MNLLDRLGLTAPIIQAPMAGVSTPRMAADVSNAGALGSIAVGASGPGQALAAIGELRALTGRAFNVNVFTHAPARSDPDREQAWLQAMKPLFATFGAEPPERLTAIYRSFNEDDEMLGVLVDQSPAVVSFHFGLPTFDRVAALRSAGCVLIATATRLEEALAARDAGMDAVVAQGYEAGGHRGVFDPGAADAQLGTMALARLLVVRSGLPVIAAGGIMDGAGVRAALDLGAVAAQLGTAFIGCPQSAADAPYRAALMGEASGHTRMTTAISGRPARCLPNRFTQWGETVLAAAPDYPIAYDAGKALSAAARKTGEFGFGAQWAGQGAPLARALPAAELIDVLVQEIRCART